MLNANIIRMSSSVRWAFNWKEWNPNEREFGQAASCIQVDEKERLKRFVFRKDVRASLVGRLLMRKFVNEYTDLPYDKITFVRDENNRPVLRHSVAVSFNVSHQGSYTVLAGEARDVKMGVDVMSLDYSERKSIPDFFRLMNRHFSTAEWEEIKDSGKSEAEQMFMFYRHWALKESYVKALGVGVFANLGSIDFQTKSGLSEGSITTDTVLHVNGIKQQNWLFEETLLDSRHCVAVALQENGSSRLHNIPFEIMNYDKLMTHAVPLFPIDSQYTIQYFAKYEQP
ncbi:L-aminoadipate-semialdehyde dehydrogenase-phosphopantetheinyl transferase [Pogonomyrmex barbatus]|uniref:L-aminoadipate-semialdehyde dehydrogenase-phosphopantetheinyl transferase n=1 Tax=Pogonomyrmex barbatus TaxID=144034 RepID=A0A8N1S6Q0_9HYME|nr:L-aminoadipate-semialdehyde dehydrogenase-phosphopantetheinyl transferase [Pogonomyrmex barbatus]XP_025074486.1 L-aminoadipate-semialdehyde dehydrogenase-phosphopantetheinyl transferase [Pogonomyrmex barbatus]